jgi:hypothetical protein
MSPLTSGMLTSIEEVVAPTTSTIIGAGDIISTFIYYVAIIPFAFKSTINVPTMSANSAVVTVSASQVRSVVRLVNVVYPV